MFENLKILYSEYGGISQLLRSGYFRVAVFLSLLSYFSDVQLAWVEVAISVMPSLAGFSIAAFALMFAVLSAEDIKVLLPRTSDGTSPLLSAVSSVVHAVIVQIFSLLLAASFRLVDSSVLISKICNILPLDAYLVVEVPMKLFFFWSAHIISSIGLLLLLYGLALVVAAVLSVFRMLSILANAKSTRQPPN